MPLKPAQCTLIIEYEQSSAGQVWEKHPCSPCRSAMFTVFIYQITFSPPVYSMSIYDWACVCVTTSSLKPPWHHWVLSAACAKASSGAEIEPFSLIYHRLPLRLSARQCRVCVMQGRREKHKNSWRIILTWFSKSIFNQHPLKKIL